MSEVRRFANLEERQAFLAKVAKINSDWHEKYESSSAEALYNLEHSNPHDKETGDTDYPFFFLDRSATPEMEQEFFDEVDKL